MAIKIEKFFIHCCCIQVGTCKTADDEDKMQNRKTATNQDDDDE